MNETSDDGGDSGGVVDQGEMSHRPPVPPGASPFEWLTFTDGTRMLVRRSTGEPFDFPVPLELLPTPRVGEGMLYSDMRKAEREEHKLFVALEEKARVFVRKLLLKNGMEQFRRGVAYSHKQRARWAKVVKEKVRRDRHRSWIR